MGMKIGYVELSTKKSSSYGIFVTGSGTFDPAEADVTSYIVPGRNGEIKLFNGRYKNITVTYPCFIPGNFETQAQAIRNWPALGSGYGSYITVTDNYDPDHYRLGLVESISFEPVNGNRAANFQLSINCKPQRFLTSGETESAITNGGTISNPTLFNALPLITFTKISSTASISVTNSLGTFTMTATAARNGSGTIDCDTLNIHDGNTNLNSLFTGDFPVLAPGTNTFAISGFTTPKITPRWWEL